MRLKPRVSKDAVASAVQGSGLACLNGAAYWWCPLAGLVVSGLFLCFVGWVMDE